MSVAVNIRRNVYPLEGIGLSINKSFDDWFLPSRYELQKIYDELYLYDIGNIDHVRSYWSSTEYNATLSMVITMSIGSLQYFQKSSSTVRTRACRSFTTTDIYNLRDVGPAGGWIFHIVDNGGGSYTYYEAASTDQSSDQPWSNVVDASLGTTSTDIGEGINNTIEIINQSGHTSSAAKLCYDL